MAQRTLPLSQAAGTRDAGRGIRLLEAITVIAIIAALLAVSARATGRLPNERTAALSDRPTRLIQMGGVWVDAATNPKRERFFRMLDPHTGAETGQTLPFRLPENAYQQVFSGDGRTLAYTDDGASLRPPVISIVDVATGTLRRSLPFDQPTFVLRLNTDGTRLLLYRFRTPSHPPFILLTVDVATGATITTVTLPSSSGAWPIISPDLHTAYVLDTHDSGTWPNVTSGAVTMDLFDTTTGAEREVPLPMIHAGVFPENRTIRDQPVIRAFSPALVPSPDSARLYIVHADGDAITVINRKEARVERNESIHPNLSAAQRLFGWLRPQHVAAKEAPESTDTRATVSPDGRTLAITGTMIQPRDDGSYDVTDQGIQFVDLQTFTMTGHVLQQQYQGYPGPLTAQWSADSRLLYIGNITNPTSGGGDSPYQLRVMDASTHAITATQTDTTGTDTPVFFRSIWFALPQ